MATVQQLVKRSLRLLGVIDANTAPDAVDMTNAITALNAMIQRWEANGLALGWPQAGVTAPTATMPTPTEADEAIVYQLACRLDSEYGTLAGPNIQAMAGKFLSELRRDRYTEAPLCLESDLPATSGRWNIQTDSPA